jgi:hypothetical protein
MKKKIYRFKKILFIDNKKVSSVIKEKDLRRWNVREIGNG